MFKSCPCWKVYFIRHIEHFQNFYKFVYKESCFKTSTFKSSVKITLLNFYTIYLVTIQVYPRKAV